MFKAVDDDDIKSLKKFLAGNPSGWKVTDKVIDLSTARIYVYIVMLSLYSMDPPCYTMLLVEVRWNVYDI